MSMHDKIKLTEHVRFDVTKEERAIIHKIMRRLVKLCAKQGQPLTPNVRMCVEMDITATHANGCKLDFQKFLDFDDFNFMHDISGIHNCINRETGKLERCFLPRCRSK